MRKMLSSRALRRATVFLAIALNFALLSDGFAQTGKTAGNAQVPIDFLKKMRPRSGLRTPITTQAATLASVPNIDSLANWTDQFSASGFDFNGNPQDIWPYSMVGAPPESGRTTVIRAPIIPVTVQLLGPDGKVATFNGVPLILSVTPDITKAVLNSPIFQPWIYTSGIGQINDQEMRAQFWDRIHRGGSDNGWHTLLAPTVRKTRVMQIPSGFWFFAPNADGSCCAFALVDSTTFGNLLFPSTAPPDNSTPIGAAENAGDMTTQDLSTLLFNNLFLYDGTPDNCCVLGFHSYDLEPGDKHNGNREKRFVMDFSSWISNGLFFFGFEDITATSHEIAETFNDPFVDNATPWWQSVDPFLGSGLCQDNLETGDVVEVLTSNPVFPISMNNRTYHPQNEALFSWFAFQSPSHAHLGAYSFPDETTLTALSPGPLLPGCAPAP